MATSKKATPKVKRARQATSRRSNQLRKVEIIRGFTKNAPGSVLIRCGRTHVLCTATIENGVPHWKRGQGTGWLTAEYDMLPGSTQRRRARNRFKMDGRTSEIQRLIGRSLRAIVDMEVLGEHSILIDCDVLQADGGTRSASIIGGYVALCDCLRHALREKIVAKSPIKGSVAAVSVGVLDGKAVLDLDHALDIAADVDFNVVMTGDGQFVEIQGAAEASTFSRPEFDRLLRLAARGIKQLTEHQLRALRQKV